MDRLEPENGLVLGPLVEFFERREEAGATGFLQVSSPFSLLSLWESVSHLFLPRSTFQLFTSEGSEATEFGAHQVILVRDDV